MIITRPFAIIFAAGGLLLSPSLSHAGQSSSGRLPPPVARFATTCDSSVSATFDRAVTALHAFWFDEALTRFHQVLERDPRCAMAYWGIAITDWGLRRQPEALAAGTAAIEKADALLGHGRTGREADYVRAAAHLFEDVQHVNPRPRILAYIAAMEEVTERYPDDREAVLFYALGILDSVVPTDKTYAARLKAGAILERAFTLQPDHPGIAHYIIHVYDVPALADRALEAARRYARIAPDVPHALHMPSHVFTRLGYWNESIEGNLRSAAAAKQMGRSGDGERLHALDYAVYASLQIGRDRAARQIVTAVPAIARGSGASRTYGSANFFATAAIPARYALERHAWAEAARLDVHPSDMPYADAVTHFARALGFAHTGRQSSARREVDALAALVDTLTAARDLYWAEQVDIQRLAALGWIAIAERQPDEGIRLLQSAADREDSTEKAGTTPGPLMPARELLGDALLELKQPAAALREYEATMKTEPNRFRAVWGAAQASERVGDRAKAHRYYAQLLEIGKAADRPERPELIHARAAAADVPGR